MKQRTLRLLLLSLLLLAAALRFYRLDAQSFWNDEGNSARIAERPLGLILEGAAGDIHPPGYYLMLHGWRALAGHSEFALRSLSAMAGLVLVALTYRLGRRSFGESIGLQAAGLAALSPFAVYYSQEARMYALLAALSAASTLLLLRLLGVACSGDATHQRAPVAPRPGTLVAYVLIAAAGLYTQYAFPFVLLVHNAVFGLWWLATLRRHAGRWRWLGLWATAQAALVILYSPWLPVALGSVTGWSAAGRGYALGAGLLDVLRVFSVGLTLPLERAPAALGCFGLLLAAGLCPRRKGLGDGFSMLVFALYLLLPVALIFALDLYKPAWLKFLLVVLPAFHVLVARGIGNLARRGARIGRGVPWIVHFAAGLLLAATVLPSLRNLYFDPAYARDDYRQIAAEIASSAQSEPCIALDAPNQWEVFTYYFPADAAYPAPYRPDPEEVEAFLNPLLERCQRLFVLYWGDAESDPQRLVETYLAGHAYPAGDRWYGNVRLATYGIAALPDQPSYEPDAAFSEAVLLRGIATEERSAPGAIVPVTLFWQAQEPLAERYKVTIQVLDADGQLVAQHDGEPGGGLAPTTAWVAGEMQVDRHGIALPSSLPAGRYSLIVGLYSLTTGDRLPVSLSNGETGNHFPLGSVEVGR